MLAFKYLLMFGSIALFVVAAGVVAYDLLLSLRLKNAPPAEEKVEAGEIRWRTGVALVGLAWLPMLIALSIAIIPSGHAGGRGSTTSGTKTGTLYPGSHLILPLVEHVDLFDLRDRLFTTGVAEGTSKKLEPLNVQAKEGLSIGLAITVRYQ